MFGARDLLDDVKVAAVLRVLADVERAGHDLVYRSHNRCVFVTMLLGDMFMSERAYPDVAGIQLGAESLIDLVDLEGAELDCAILLCHGPAYPPARQGVQRVSDLLQPLSKPGRPLVTYLLAIGRVMLPPRLHLPRLMTLGRPA